MKNDDVVTWSTSIKIIAVFKYHRFDLVAVSLPLVVVMLVCVFVEGSIIYDSSIISTRRRRRRCGRPPSGGLSCLIRGSASSSCLRWVIVGEKRGGK